MPIRDIQRRHAELGRIRLGYKAETERGGTRPAKLQRFRFTSPSETYIRDLANLYGGEARPWDNGGKAEWEVFTEAASIPVIAVKGGLSQWMETWSGGGCIHRCDGEQMLDGTPCEQDPTTIRIKDDNHQWVEVPAHDAAKPTTRLAVMLPELDAIGVWRLETHGWNAAAELPTVAELAQFVGQLVPAELHLVERRAIKDGQTSRFVVPVLDLRIGARRLAEIAQAVAGGAELEAAAGSSALALEAGSSTPAAAPSAPVDNADDYADWREQVRQAASLDELGSIWRRMVAEKLVGPEATMTPSAAEFVAFFKDRGRQVPQHPATTAEPDADGIVDAEIVPDPPPPAAAPSMTSEDPNVVWQTLLARAGQLGMTSADLEDDFASRMGGLTAAEATAAEMHAYLTRLEEHAR